MPTPRVETVATPAVSDRRPLTLCIDDDPVMLDVIEAYLSGEDWELVRAGDGREGIEAAGRRMPDLVLLDVTMPDMDGYAVCAELTARPDAAFTPVIFLTALGGERDKMKAFAAGAADYLTKPVDAGALLKKVKTHLATRRAWRSLEESTVPAGPVA